MRRAMVERAAGLLSWIISALIAERRRGPGRPLAGLVS